MFNNLQFRQLIIQPVLRAIYLYSQEAEDLLVGTCAQESRGGTYLFQEGTNPDLYASLQKNILAVGVYQMQSATHHRVSEPIPKTLELQAEYYKKYYNTAGGKATVDEYITNYNNFVGVKK